MATKTALPRRGRTPVETVKERTKEPVMGVTSYDTARAFMVAIVLALVCAVGFLLVEYLSNVESVVTQDKVAMQLLEVENPGGYEDGYFGETLRVDSPYPPAEDAAMVEIDSDVVEAEAAASEEVLDDVIDFSDQAATSAPQPFQATFQTNNQQQLGYQESGKRGSATGNGRRALGSGGGTGSGFPREMRWFVRFSDEGTIDTYARQLDYFRIQFGVLNPDGKLTYVSNFSKSRPDTQVVSSGKDEKRLYFTWQGGGRKGTDIKLFAKAGVNAASGTIFHFYPEDIENQLAVLEFQYRNRPAKEIRRTYFVVEPEGDGYKFTVVRQTYLN